MHASRRHRPPRRPEFRVESKPEVVEYDALLDSNLNYYFSSKNNRSILRKTRVINSRNQVMDRSVNKAV